MTKAQLEELITHLETHLECWRQFSGFVAKAKAKDFNPDDENEFLEIKSSLIQQLEIIRTFILEGGPSKDDILDLMGSAPSIQAINELSETGLRTLENNWHKIFVGWQMVMGQIKAGDRELGVPELQAQLENHLEFWKQYHGYIVKAQKKQFSPEDEQEFLEVKSGMVQELEIILGAIEDGAPSREEIHTLISDAPSIEYMSELGDNSLRTIENNWHKLYVEWQGVVGQLKGAVKKLSVDELLPQLENHIEGLKQFNGFVSQAGSGSCSPEDEMHFLEVKSNLAQELEILLGTIQEGAPQRGELQELVSSAPSLDYVKGLSESARRTLENNWHKVFLAWQAVLGQVKVMQQNSPKKKGFFSRLFGG